MENQKLSVTFYGGVEEVTGANFVLEIKNGNQSNKIAVDCGLSQGSEFSEEKKNEFRERARQEAFRVLRDA